MRFGLGTLRLPPAAFWAMSVPELAAALAPRDGAAAVDARRLRTLIDHDDQP